jgi:hypothetical protein
MSVTFAIKPLKCVALWEDRVSGVLFLANDLDDFYPLIQLIFPKDNNYHTPISITTSGIRYSAVKRRSAIFFFFFVFFFVACTTLQEGLSQRPVSPRHPPFYLFPHALLTYYAFHLAIPPALATYLCLSPSLLYFFCYRLPSLDRTT